MGSEPDAARARRLLRKSAVITGAARGIGRATAELFALEGARIVASDIDGDGLNGLRERLQAQGAEVVVVQGDVAKPDETSGRSLRATRRAGGERRRYPSPHNHRGHAG